MAFQDISADEACTAYQRILRRSSGSASYFFLLKRISNCSLAWW